MTIILTKKKDTSGAPSASDLTNSTGGAELAVNTADKRLYTKDSGGNIVEVGTNPSTITSGAITGTTGQFNTSLNVDGTVTADGLTVTDDAAAGTTEQIFIRGLSDNNKQLRLGFDTTNNYGIIQALIEGTDWQSLALNPYGGKVGIGTASPASKLSIASGDILLDNTRSIIFKDNGGVARAILQYFSDNSTYLDAPNGNTVFRNGTSNTEKMRIDASGNLLVGTTTSPSDTGTVVADGIYLGGTVAANLLDDYEEGTWTPTTASDATGVISGENGRYIKVGSLVYCSAIFSVTTNFTSDQIGGLPFDVKAPGGSSFVGKYISYTSTSAVDFTVLTSERLKFDTTLNTTNNQYRMMFVYEAA